MRYKLEEGSNSGHGCCFDWTVVDTFKRHPVYPSKFDNVCECAGKDAAELIVRALNAGYGETLMVQEQENASKQR